MRVDPLDLGLYYKILTPEQSEAILAKLARGNYIYWPKADRFEMIGTFEVRGDRRGFYYAAYGCDTMKSVHFHDWREDIIILTEQEAELAKVLYGKTL
jgi:hypothetical protein